ncbi:Aste57867_10912 [Aphanomyces stellatus]|uniref:Aste57867_10912 protein n=1 Tax=Aphanomyces stellatus TaxID=120398 RepID=A0A485KRJ8_9STRA|nr:hypothetical protein As57867_010872 [Aphanomyces stellatus]VFT87780.1 Aste57867_10912 [Aphanomyces stellatus]
MKARPKTAGGGGGHLSGALPSPLPRTGPVVLAKSSRANAQLCPPIAATRRPAVAVMKSTIKITANIEVQVRPDAALMNSNQQRLQALSHRHLQPDIDFDGLRPLIDIAYWSTFGEVRRDAAAAFATLSKNEANLEILAQAGALGASLAFLNGAKDHMDLSVLRDAADTLAQLVQLPSIQAKLLNAPNGIAAVFALLRIADVRLKRTALTVLLRMLALPDGAVALVQAHGFGVLLQLLRGLGTRKDIKLKQMTALLLKRLAEPVKNKDVVAENPELVETLCHLFQDPYLDVDAAFRRDLLECTLLLAQDRRIARHLVDFRVVPSLLFLLSAPPPPQATFLLLSLLEVFASDTKNQASLLHDDILPSLMAAAFLEPNSTMLLADVVALRVKALLICNHLVLIPATARNALIEIGIVDTIAAEKLHRASDKRIKKLSIALLTTLTWVDEPPPVPRAVTAVAAATNHPFHVELVSRGLLTCLFELLEEDLTVRVDVISAMWHLCESDCTRVLLCKQPVLEAFLLLSIQHDAPLRTKIAKILADFATKAENAHKLIESRIVLFLVKSIAPSCRHEVLRYEATRAFVGLACADDEQVRDRLVKSGVVGFLLRITKLPDPKSTVAAATCTLAALAVQHLRQDVAALRIQSIMRNFLAKNAVKTMRLDAFTSSLSPRRKRFQHVAFRAGKVLAPKEEASTEAIQNRFLSAGMARKFKK